MFDVLVESTSRRRGARMWAYFAVSSAFWLAVFATTAIASVMMYDARLDAELDKLNLVAYVPEMAPPREQSSPRPDAAPRQPNEFVSRTEVPTTIAPPRVVPPSTGPSTTGLPTDQGAGYDGGVPNSTGTLPPGFPVGPGTGSAARVVEPPPAPEPDPPQPPPPSKPVSKGPITGMAVKRVVPPYPYMAEKVGVTGTVVVEVLVSEQGSVLSARTLSGHPLLREAAERAARAWKFTPTTLSGVPVKVVGTISFTFKKP